MSEQIIVNIAIVSAVHTDKTGTILEGIVTYPEYNKVIVNVFKVTLKTGSVTYTDKILSVPLQVSISKLILVECQKVQIPLTIKKAITKTWNVH